MALIDGIAMELRAAARDAKMARGLIYAMVLDADEGMRTRQLQGIEEEADVGIAESVRQLYPLLANINPLQRIVLVEEALSALKKLPMPAHQRFSEYLVALSESDLQITLFEWVLHQIVLQGLTPRADSSPNRTLATATKSIVTLLSTLANHGGDMPPTGPGNGAGMRSKTAMDKMQTTLARQAFAQGCQALDIQEELDDSPDPDYLRLSHAIRDLRELPQELQEKVLDACATIALADAQLAGDEVALLYAFATALNCPLPNSIAQAVKALDNTAGAPA